MGGEPYVGDQHRECMENIISRMDLIDIKQRLRNLLGQAKE